MAVLVFTSYPAERYATKVLHQGARAYLQKTCDLGELKAEAFLLRNLGELPR